MEAMDKKTEVTSLIQRAVGGDAAARDQVFLELRDEIHQCAQMIMKGQDRQVTVEAGVLVSEGFLRVASAMPEGGADRGDKAPLQFDSRLEFLKFLTRTMKRILISYGRSRGATKRGGGQRVERLDSEIFTDRPLTLQSSETAVDFCIDISNKLRDGGEEEHAELFDLVRVAGLSPAEAGECLGWDEAMSKRYWDYVTTVVKYQGRR